MSRFSVQITEYLLSKKILLKNLYRFIDNKPTVMNYVDCLYIVIWNLIENIKNYII